MSIVQDCPADLCLCCLQLHWPLRGNIGWVPGAIWGLQLPKRCLLDHMLNILDRGDRHRKVRVHLVPVNTIFFTG